MFKKQTTTLLVIHPLPYQRPASPPLHTHIQVTTVLRPSEILLELHNMPYTEYKAFSSFLFTVV